jgi:hypothetical protein
MHVDKARDSREIALVASMRGCWNANFIPAAHGGNLFAIG